MFQPIPRPTVREGFTFHTLSSLMAGDQALIRAWTRALTKGKCIEPTSLASVQKLLGPWTLSFPSMSAVTMVKLSYLHFCFFFAFICICRSISLFFILFVRLNSCVFNLIRLFCLNRTIPNCAQFYLTSSFFVTLI